MHTAQGTAQRAISGRPRQITTDLAQLPGMIRDARKRLGLTQQQAATELGISRVYLGYLETGKYYPSTDTFLAICHWAGIDPMSLVK